VGTPIAVQAGLLVPAAIKFFRYYAGQAYEALKGESWPSDDEDGAYKVFPAIILELTNIDPKQIVQHQAYGVCALIAAWNATITYFAAKIAAALAAGNTVIFKASEKSPLAVLLLAPLLAQAGFPPGVVNIISGAGQTGDLLAHHMQIRMISFTGSAFVGRKILEASAKSNMKRVALELGGKSPAIVFKDADLKKAIPTIGQAILALTGQVCICASRVLVEEEVYEEVVAAVKTFLEGSRKLIGDPMDSKSMVGPLVDEAQFNRVMGFISVGKDEAKLAVGGERIGEKGFFVQPTLFLNPGKEARIWKEEIFGPVMMINAFKTEEEAIEMANDTDYGLYASIYTADMAKALRVAGHVEAGTVSINKGFQYDINTAFGGWKGSGLGREGGMYGLKEFLQEKSIKISMS
jgi:aldehyde dehydrogenase (NAD+)